MALANGVMDKLFRGTVILARTPRLQGVRILSVMEAAFCFGWTIWFGT